MPFDSNGNFSLVPGTIVADGMNVQPSQHNPPFQDIAQGGLSLALVRDGRAPMTGVLNMNGNKITGVASGTDPSDVVTNADIADLGVAIGDGKWSLRDLSPNWLRRDGSLYLRSAYPDLADLLPVLPDGVIWENRSSGTSGTIYDITQMPDRFLGIARGTGGDSSIVASLDEGEWTVRQILEDFFAQSIAYGGGIAVALGGNGAISLSTDGDVWSPDVQIDSGTIGIAGLAFGNGVFVASGIKDGNKALWRSSDGVTWARVGPTGLSGVFQAVRYLGTRFVAVGSLGDLYYSTDGASWTSAVTGAGSLSDVAFDGATYVIVGSTGFIATSTNLSGWTTRSSGTTVNLNGVGASSVGFIVVGASGVVRISATGTSWSSVISGTTAALRSVLVDANNDARYLVSGVPSNVLYGMRTQPTQFRVPNDDPTYGWIRAL